MRKKSSFQELMLIMEDIQTQSARSVTFAIFNRDKIAHFHKANEPAIRHFNNFMEGLLKAHAKHTPDGKPVYITDANGQSSVAMNSAEDSQAFQDAYWTFLKEEVWITT